MKPKFRHSARFLTLKSLLTAALLIGIALSWPNPVPAQKIATPGFEKDGWAMAEVVVDSALIHQKPNDVSFITGSVSQGELLWFKSISEDSEWFLVRPEQGALSWILESDISEIHKGEGRVKSAAARVRPGRVGARLPGPPGLELPQGSTVWLLPREPLVLPQREGLITWRAIEPPVSELRYVRKTNLRPVEKKTAKPESVEGFVAARGPGTFASAMPPATADKQKSAKPGADAAHKKNQSEISDLPADDQAPDLTKPTRPSIEDLAILDAPGTSILRQPEPGEEPAGSAPLKPEHPQDFEKKPAENEPESPARTTAAEPLELPADPDQALEILDSRFRLIVSQPLVAWDFQAFLKSCDQLARQPLSASQAARLGSLREKAAAQDEIGSSSRKFWDSMRRSRSYDPALAGVSASPALTRKPRFDITGLMLPSRRDIDGHMLYNLIGESGTTTAYLKIPPASPVEKWLGKRVGVRGRVRYNEELRARLVIVQDLELLDPVDE